MSAKYKSPSFLLPNELNTSANPANDTGINSLYSMNFDGSQNIDCGNISALNGATQATWSCWYKKTANGAVYFMGTWGGSSARLFLPYQFSQGAGALMNVYMGSSTGSSRLMFQNATNCVINLNTWYHMAFVYNESESSNSDKLKFYLDATELPNETTGFALTSLNTVTASFNIGAPFTPSLTGKLDEVAIFNRALDSTEIAALYGGTSPNIYPSNLMATNLNPIAYYPLGEQAQNSGYPSATGNEWQFPNGVLQDYVMDFDGNSKINCGPAKAYNVVTLSAWVKPDSPATYDGIFGTRNGSNVDFPYQLTNFGGKFRFIADGNTSILSDNAFSNGVWYHVMGIADGTNLKMYVDGQLQNATASYSTPLPTPNNDLMIGAQWDTDVQYEWSGKISNVAIWNTDQSTNKDNIYNNGSPQTTYTVTPQNWWKLNADSVYNLGIGLDGFDGADNTGGGAGGGGSRYAGTSFYVGNGGQGGSGIVVLKYPTILNPDFSSDLTTSSSVDGSNTLTYITKGTGTITFGNAGTISDYLIVAGGGGGGSAVNNGNGEASGGGGGGGGLLTGTSLSVSAQSYNITIGEGGAGGLKTMGSTIGNQGENGQDSIFSTLTAVGGGGGGAGQVGANALSAGKNGGSGGGPGGSSGAFTSAGGAGSQGSDGGVASNKRAAGGGGGYSSAGSNATSNDAPGDGGNGYLYSLTNTYYAGGGGGGVWYMSGSIPDGGSAGDGSTGTGGAPKQQGDTTPLGPNFSNWWKIPTALTIPSINYTTALDFDPSGSGDYISFGNQSAFEPASNYTFSIWFNGASSSYALFGTNSSAGTGVHALLTGTKILYYHGNQSVMEFNHGGLNIWHNFTVTWSSSTGILRSFIDGKYATQKVGVNSITWSNDLEVGRYNGGQFKYDGKLSNFAMWNTTLTDGFSGTPAQSQVAGGQVAEIYNNGQPQASITGSPVGWWKLDDQNTITDYSGNNYTGTNNGALDAPGDVTSPSFNIPVNGVSTTLPSTALQQSDLQFDSPYSNYSLSFDGTGDYITVTQDFSSYTSMSVSGWVRTASTSQYQYLFSTGVYNGGTPGNGQGFGIGFDNTGKFAAWAGGANYFTFGSVSANTWYHVIQTITGTTLRFYVNGVLTSTQTVGSFNIPSSAIAVIGAYSGNSIPTQSNLYGKADELSIFNYELTTSQVLEIYNNGRPKDLTTFSGTAPTNWWRLGENAYFDNNSFIVPNSISGAPNGTGSGTVTSMLSADAPGTYANGIGDGLAITDRVGDAALSTANSQSYNMIPDNKVPYVPGYIGAQISNTSEMTFNGVDSFLNTTNIDLGINSTLSMWFKPGTNPTVNDYALIGEGSNGFDYLVRKQSGSAFYVWVGSGQVSSNAHNYGSVIANNINVGGWNFLAIQKAGDTITVYLKNTNGEFDATATKSAWATTSMTFDRIGARTISPVAQVFSGQIDEVAGFSETLTADQIKFDLYSATTTGKTADIENNTNLPTPVAWYRM